MAQTIVITGGNAGLGYGCAAALLRSKARTPFHVIIACRDLQRGREAVDRLTQNVAGCANQVEAMLLDLASLASVRAFANELITKITTGESPPLYGVVCNAGVQSGTKRTFTTDGFESTFGVNHLGHFLLVNLLMPILSAPGRVVVVSSGTHDPANKAPLPLPAWNDPVAIARGELGPTADGDKPFARGQRLYTTSKLANIYFTYALVRRLPGGITANVYDPGLMLGTGLTREAPAPLQFLAKYVLPALKPLLRRFVTPHIYTPEASGAILASLLTNPTLTGSTGKYFLGSEEIRSSVESYDESRAEELWRASEALTRVN